MNETVKKILGRNENNKVRKISTYLKLPQENEGSSRWSLMLLVIFIGWAMGEVGENLIKSGRGSRVWEPCTCTRTPQKGECSSVQNPMILMIFGYWVTG